MTASPASDTFVPDQRPVRRFVAVIASIAMVLAIVWWSGALASRLSIVCGLDHIETGPDADTVRIGVRNDGPLPVDITGADIDPDVDVDVVTDVDVVSLRVHGVELPAGGARVGGGETAVVEISLVVNEPVPDVAPGPGHGAAPPALWVDIGLDTAAGVEHTHRVGVVPFYGADCPVRSSPPS